jgi:DNA invertase Pin-like site-specific DNA recombinase
MPSSSAPPVPAAVYARVSSVRQAAPDLKSLATQVDECLTYAGKHNLSVAPEFIVEEVFTGTVTEHRPKLEALVNQMVKAGVRHIIMDETKRFTREGQAAADYLLHYLEEHGLMLHLAMDDMAVNSEVMTLVVMTKAFAAKLDNEERVKKGMRNKREYARSFGRFPISPYPSYGWLYEPCDLSIHGRPHHYRLVHNPETYPTLLSMIRMRQAGRSWHDIAHSLTRAGIPVGSAGREKGASASGAWAVGVVKKIVENPVNAGRWEAFRHKTVEMPADAEHPSKWKKRVLAPPEERILLPAELVEEPPLSWEQHLAILAMAERGPRHAPLFAPVSMPEGKRHPCDDALFRGGALTHTDCGLRLQVKSIKGRREGTRHAYYHCYGSPHAADYCDTGFNAPIAVIDDLVWRAIRRVPLVPGRLKQVAEAQRAADLAALEAGEGLGSVSSLEAHRKRLEHELANFLAAVGSAKEGMRPLYEQKAEETQARLAEVKAQLAVARSLAADEDRRRLVLSTARTQLVRYATLVGVLDLVPDRRQRVAVQRTVLRALGARVSVTHAKAHRHGQGLQAGKCYKFSIELRLADALAQPWFGSTRTPEEVPDDLVWENLAGSLPTLRKGTSSALVLAPFTGASSSLDLAPGESEMVEEDGHVRFVFVSPPYRQR